MMNAAQPLAVTPSALSLSDIWYVLFRHKWKILVCSLLGLGGAAAVFKLQPAPYNTEAKLFIRYVLTENRVGPTGVDRNAKSPDQRGETIINSEVEILTSMDLARQVAEAIGPAKILGNPAASNDIAMAALTIRRGLTVKAPMRSSIIFLSYRHGDRTVAQAVLRELIQRYLRMHSEIHRSKGMLGDFLVQETDQLRARLVQTQDELRKARLKAGVFSIDDAKKTVADQMNSIRQQIYTTQAEFAQRASLLKGVPSRPAAETTSAAPDSSAAAVPSEQIDQHRTVAAQVLQLKAMHQRLLGEFTGDNPRVKEVRAQIAAAEAEKRAMEEQFPSLATMGSRPAGSSGAQFDPTAAAADAVALQAKLKVLNAQYEELRLEGAKLDQLESDVSELRRKNELDDANYRLFAASLEQSRVSEALSDGRVSNITQIQTPSVPIMDVTKRNKTMLGIAFAGVALGLAWAFLLDLLIDRSVKRPSDIERALRIPLFLSIPKLGRKQLNGAAHVARPLLQNGNGTHAGANGTSQQITGPFDIFHETLRDRLISYFESRGLTHKPKLVAITSLAKGAGVTTTAAGLARSLSETGEGNVLLVDMTAGQGSAQQFVKGQAVCGLDEMLDRRQNAHVDQNLYVVAENSNSEKLSRNLPQRFIKLVPRLKASDFDYIVFDMPVVSQISITPRMAGFMDMVLMVVESERTDRDVVQRAAELLGSRAHIGVVLNKSRNYVPRLLQSELLTCL